MVCAVLPRWLLYFESFFIHRSTDILNSAAHTLCRFAFNDDDVPEWFGAEDAEHRVLGVVETKEMMDEIKVRVAGVSVN